MAANPEFQAICDKLFAEPDSIYVLPGGKAILMAHPDGENLVAVKARAEENFEQMTNDEINAYITDFFS